MNFFFRSLLGLVTFFSFFVPASLFAATGDVLPPDAVAKITENITTKLPAEMSTKAAPFLSTLEQFRSTQAQNANNMVNTGRALLSLKKSSRSTTEWGILSDGITTGDIIRAPWEYAKFFVALCYQFFTTNLYAFYILLSYIAYKIIRVVIRAVV